MSELNYSTWTAAVLKLFQQPEEYELAAKLYCFKTAFVDGLSPLEAYRQFDKLAVGASA